MPAANLGGLIPVPSPPGLYCMRFQPPLLETAESVMSVLGANHRATNMARCLDEDWRRRHTTLMHDTCPPCGPTGQESRCKTAGVCLCCPSGKLLLTFSNRFIQAIKQVCPVDSDNRKLLANGKLVALLQGTPAEREGQDGQEHPQGNVHNQLFFHIALQYFSPYRPTFHMVLPAAAPPGEPAADERRLYVQATPSGSERLQHPQTRPGWPAKSSSCSASVSFVFKAFHRLWVGRWKAKVLPSVLPRCCDPSPLFVPRPPSTS